MGRAPADFLTFTRLFLTPTNATAMNPPPPPIPAPQPPPAPADPASPLTAMPHPPGVGATIESLLRRPGQAVHELWQGGRAGQLMVSFGLVAILGLLAFGLAAGSFAGGTQWWAAPLKITFGTLFAALICLPSLYIFLCLSGAEIRFGTTAGLLAGGVALTGILLAGLTPIVWVFSQSTGSAAFMGAMLIIAWLVALLAGLGFLRRGARWLGLSNGFHLQLWTLMFLVVTIQMSCALRPILGHADSFLPKEKRFFLAHWGEQLQAEGDRVPQAPPSDAQRPRAVEP